ncbi:MAG: transcriptional regulator, MerR family [Frankiales bacterium]|nr:transcriptional regulator, MerR family [Frankiales bacterium]
MAEVPEDGATLDELARLSGMTARNVRAHQERGLLPPPQVRGRVGYYGQDHLDRLRMIAELQAEGLSLAAVQRTMQDVPPGRAGQALAVRRSLLDGWDDEQPEVYAVEELRGWFGDDVDKILERAGAMGLVVRLEEGVEVLAPSLLGALRDVAALGVPAAVVLDVQERLAKATDQIAAVFAGFVLTHLYKPDGDAPAHDLVELGALVDAMRPLAVRATVTNLGRSLSKQVERTLAETTKPRRRGRR